jgi:hypothetical protein
MKALLRLLPVFFAIAILISCGGEQQESAIIEARSMEEALSLAAENNSFVVIEFWMDG